MSGETEANVSGWTTDTLRSYILALLNERDTQYAQRFQAQEKAVDYALGAADRAVSKAELATEKRFEGVNEFRGQLADQARTLMPRAETELQLVTLGRRLSAVELTLSEGGARKEGADATVAFVVAGLTTIIAAVAVVVAVIR